MKDNETVSVKYQFSVKSVDVFFHSDFSMVDGLANRESTVLITDENIFEAWPEKFSGWKTIVLKAGEAFKNQEAVDGIIARLIGMNADRQSFVVGVGGGVVTDIAGYAASVYMRGIPFGFVPTSILSMVDASIGGKNGVDVGVYKNLVGVISHPQFLLYDFSFLSTLPEAEWVNGFAEIIKHACIRDESLFRLLEQSSLKDFQSSPEMAGQLIRRNADIKYEVVSRDEHETGERKLLNFGHTIGHAIEKTEGLPHGSAVSIGMVAACAISEQVTGFPRDGSDRVRKLLARYQLPVALDFDRQKAWDILLHDKKKSGNEMNFVVLDQIGKASVKKMPLNQLRAIYNQL